MWCKKRERLYQAIITAKEDGLSEALALSDYRRHLLTCKVCIDDTEDVFRWARERRKNGSDILDQAVPGSVE